MRLLDDARRSREDEVAGDEDGFGIVHAEGGAALEPVQKVQREVGRGDLGVAEDAGNEAFGTKEGPRVNLQPGSQGVDPARWKGEADRVRVASEAGKERVFVRMGDGFEEVVFRDGAAGAVSFAGG